MKPLIYKIFTTGIVAVFFFTSPNFMFAQGKLLGELTIENNASASGEQFVTVNGERVISGRSIMSPAEIETAPQTTAKISLAKTGIIKIAPNSKMNLYFDNASISGDFLRGNLTVDALPFTKFNILTADGAITASNINNENVFVVNLVNNKTQVKTLSGEVLFNGVLLVAGQTYPGEIGNTNSNTKKDDNSGNSGSSNILLITLGAIGAVAAVVALSLSGGGNNNNSTVSPTR